MSTRARVANVQRMTALHRPDQHTDRTRGRIPARVRAAGVLATVALLAAGCGDAADTEPDVASAVTATPDGGLVLDYTAYIAGAIQPSGLGLNEDGSLVAIVTDFERVLLADTATQDATVEFSVARGELPRQGSTEAVAFSDDSHVVVLYPDDKVIGRFTLDGQAVDELLIESDGSVDGALASVDGDLLWIGRTESDAHLYRYDTQTDTVVEVSLAPGLPVLEGMTVDVGGEPVVGVSGDGTVFEIDAATGEHEVRGRVVEVTEPSGIAIFVNADEEEVQVAVTDDADQYNAEPSPLRLYVE